jgi:hypothetical protein
MRRVGHAFDPLIAALRGRPLAGTDWLAVIALANHALLTPALYLALLRAGQLNELPKDVGEYLRFIYECNRERNRRLHQQLLEAVAALNEQGIVPYLLKGAACLFQSAERAQGRITSDLDVAVDGAELPKALGCLEELGYLPLEGGRGMARPQDAGVLELRAIRAEFFHRPGLVERGSLRVRIASAESCAFQWILHDLVKEGDYLRGRIGLRHLYDLYELAESGELDWETLRGLPSDRRGRNAIDTQLCALHLLFGVKIPQECVRRPLARLQHWRRMVSARHPFVGPPLRLAGNLWWCVVKLIQSENVHRRRPLALLWRGAGAILDRDLRSKV